jgi:hypothetical protein
MGFVGRFAASRTGARLTASVFILGALLGQACSVERPVSGPVLLTTQWKTIEPSEPLRVERTAQEVCLQVGEIRDVNIENGVMLADDGVCSREKPSTTRGRSTHSAISAPLTAHRARLLIRCGAHQRRLHVPAASVAPT